MFLLGDSLANGNWWTDQADILSTLIANALESRLPEGYHQVEALNASANSWGPRNELAYVERFGTFGASTVVLLLNTDDLFGTQPTSLQVGRDRNYPNRNFPLAMVEVLSRLFKKNQAIPGLQDIQNEKGDRVGKNLTAIDGIYQIVSRHEAEQRDRHRQVHVWRARAQARNHARLNARERLKSWASEHHIVYLDLLSTFQQHPDPDSLYRDHIHLSPMGNQLVSDLIAQAMSERF